MNDLPWSRPGRFYKGNVHTHSTRSDATRDPEAVCAEYRENGYDFISLTDHFLDQYDYPVTDTRRFRSERFTTILGAELHAGEIEAGGRWHIVAVGLPLDFEPPSEAEDGPGLAARARAAGAFVALAHPAWYALTLDDALSVEAAHAVETWNETCRWLNDRADSWHLLDQLLVRGRRLTAIATDDAHFHERPDWRAAWVQVRAASLDPDALLESLKAGHFYSSTGPSIDDLRVEGNTLRVTCSPARELYLSGLGARRAQVTGDGVREAEFPLALFRGSYCRLTVVDAQAKRAWSNPIWLDG